jgi:hypothetical protein
MIRVEGRVDRVSADWKYLLDIRNAILEDEGLPIIGDGRDPAGWCEAIDIAVEKFEVEKIFEGKR